MAARRARRGKKKAQKVSMQPVIIGAVAIVAVAMLYFSGIFKKSGSSRSNEPTPNFRISDYRRDGSRFASTGNTYIFDGRVENIETIGNDRIVSISIPNNVDERLPLLIPGSLNLRVNLTRGDRFLFETSCRTGSTPEGEQVKGILIVKRVETL